MEVPQQLEMYSAGLNIIFEYYCQEESGLDLESFAQLLTDCNIVPDPSLPSPRGNTPGKCRLGAVPSGSVSKIFRSGVRNRGGSHLVSRIESIDHNDTMCTFLNTYCTVLH
jgi:hypothetical protein